MAEVETLATGEGTVATSFWASRFSCASAVSRGPARKTVVATRHEPRAMAARDSLAFVISKDMIAASVSLMTPGEIAIDVNRVNPGVIAAFTVDCRSADDTWARAASRDPITAMVTSDGATPRRTSASAAGPGRASRLLTVPIGQPSRLGRLLVRQALEIAEHKHRAVALGQEAQLLVEHRFQVAVLAIFPGREGCRLMLLGISALVEPAAVGGREGRAGHPVCHALKPARNGLPVPDRSGMTRQDQERGLKRVLHIVRVAQDAATGGQHHARAVPAAP